MCKLNLLGWYFRKTAAIETNVRMGVCSIFSWTTTAGAEVHITLKAVACLSICLETESTSAVGGQQ